MTKSRKTVVRAVLLGLGIVLAIVVLACLQHLEPQCDDSQLAKGTHYDRDAYNCTEAK